MTASSKPGKERLDKLLVDRGLCETRSQAQGLILAGHVLVSGQVADKPGQLFSVTSEIALKEKPKYVSRGGLKLDHALRAFEIAVAGRVCLDVGASSGGFTDCLLQAGAVFVHAVDVGHGQLDWKLRQDARVSVREKTHILDLDPASLEPKPDLAVVDVSFISLKKVMPKVVSCLTPRDEQHAGEIVALLKPQFEYLDYCEAKGFRGVVQDPADHEVIVNGVLADLGRALPQLRLMGLETSPILGPKGNREFLLHYYLMSVDDVPVPYDRDQWADRIRQVILKNS